jgi:biotin synthase
MSVSDQALCVLAGANSIFSSDTKVMLTRAVPSPDYDEDLALLEVLGLKTRPAYRDRLDPACNPSPLSSPA